MTLRFPLRRLPAALIGLAAPAAAFAQAPAAPDPRPPAVAYTVLDGARIETPLTETPGDALRGLALFADPRTGGCVACHAAPGLSRRDVAPRILRDRLPPLPPPPESEALQPPEDPAPADSELAPARAPLPAPRPGGDSPEGDLAADDAAPPLLPLPVGPDLTGIGARLAPAELRLTVVNPRIANPRTRMPAYHHISLALAERTPALRQPWLDAQQIEDIVAYLAALDEPRDPAPRAPSPQAPTPAAPPRAEPAPQAPPPDAAAPSQASDTAK